MELALIPLEELIDEIENRCPCMVIAYTRLDDKKINIYFRYGKGNWFTAVHISTILANDVLNNWNGELKTLQRIHDEESSGD